MHTHYEVRIGYKTCISRYVRHLNKIWIAYNKLTYIYFFLDDEKHDVQWILVTCGLINSGKFKINK